MGSLRSPTLTSHASHLFRVPVARREEREAAAAFSAMRLDEVGPARAEPFTVKGNPAVEGVLAGLVIRPPELADSAQ